jgi:hypothetical protein
VSLLRLISRIMNLRNYDALWTSKMLTLVCNLTWGGAVSGEYASSFVQGFQHLPEDPRYLAASACCTRSSVSASWQFLCGGNCHALLTLSRDELTLNADAGKHFVANSLEDSRTVNIHHTRYSADPNITMQDLVDSYLAPFQACVEKGEVSGLMCR